ncbi:hypothetical protein FH972_018284 [Carpinus fangiana]|uniref:Sugar phosphate transporter domain-containing protein n=1 Tax=Carpinus fangiana TaxID=176857 RepID=A0A5N6RPI8_9ROSI|nr:hypothetical protein FH972_018284 [Carpinus fangiana]
MVMAPSSKADDKAAVDAAAWMFNVVTSVGIIIVNKALMATYGFSFATTLTGLHFAMTTLMTLVLRWLGYVQSSHLPFPDLLKFVIFANFSIVGMNVSLMWNSVGFYQEGLNLHVVLGMVIAVVGMIWYGNASSKPGGKERRSHSLPTTRQQKHSGLSESGELDGKV